MTDVAGVQKELGRNRQSVNLVHGGLQRSGNVWIRGLVEAHVAVADLREAQFASHFLGVQRRQAAETIGTKDAAADHAEGSRASPGHAFQESAPVNSILVNA